MPKKQVPDIHANVELHPFGAFLQASMRAVIVGTFPGKQFSQLPLGTALADPKAWSYGGRNQLWPILSHLYQVPLPDRAAKQALLVQEGIGVMDLIKSCRRTRNSNLDNNLSDITWNETAFKELLEMQPELQLWCTGQGVARILNSWFPDAGSRIIALPSPSPAYPMRLADKIAAWERVVLRT